MKKLFAVLLVALLALTGCGSGNETPSSKVKVGTGIVSTVDATDAGEKAGKFQTNVTYAVVVLDGDGKILQVQIDTNQNSFPVTADSVGDFTNKVTKKNLKEDYGMVKNGGSELEWYEQIAVVEKAMVGKTASELDKLGDVADVASSVSITTDGYVAAVKAAIENAVEVDAAIAKVGAASIAEPKVDGTGLEISTTVTTVALDADGKVVYSFVDVAQLKGTAEAGKVVAGDNLKTKRELGTDYGMKKAGSKLEWYEQADKFQEWTIGKTIADVLKADSDADLTSSVSIHTTSFTAGLEAAAKAAIALD